MYRSNIYTVLNQSAKFWKSVNLNTPEIVLFSKSAKPQNLQLKISMFTVYNSK